MKLSVPNSITKGRVQKNTGVLQLIYVYISDTKKLVKSLRATIDFFAYESDTSIRFFRRRNFGSFGNSRLISLLVDHVVRAHYMKVTRTNLKVRAKSSTDFSKLTLVCSIQWTRFVRALFFFKSLETHK